MITYDIDLFIGRNKPAKAAVVKCCDTGVNLRVHLKTEKKASSWRTETSAYSIPTGATAFLKIEKPDKKYVLQDGICKGSTVLFALPSQSFTSSGISSAEVQLFDRDGRRLTTETFYIEVPKEIADDCEEDSENYVSIMAEQIKAAVEAAERAEAAENGAVEKIDETVELATKKAVKTVESAADKKIDDIEKAKLGAVLYDTDMKLTEDEKQRALFNIGASAEFKKLSGYLPIGENAGYFLMADKNGNIRSSGVPASALKDDVVKSWKDVQNIVRAGIASNVFSLGDLFTCRQNGRLLSWEIIGFDQDTPSDSSLSHSLTLQLNNLWVRYMQYDGEELLWRNPEPIPSGTTVSVSTGPIQTVATLRENTTYTFIVDRDIPKGCEFKGNMANETARINIYNGLTCVSSGIIAQLSASTGTSGISPMRIKYGWGSWTHSAIKQWLNSQKPAGSVWTPAHPFDGSPLWLKNEDGFLYNMDADFLEVVGKVKKKTWIQGDRTGTLQEDDELFFLPSAAEVGVPSYGHNEEGQCYQYYLNGGNDIRIKYLAGTAATYWLRTNYGNNNPQPVKVVRNTGELQQFVATDRAGVAPICNIV